MKNLLFTPGPVMIDKKIRNIGKKQLKYFRNKTFSKTLLECEKMLLKLTNAPKKSRVIFMSGSGTLGMEASVNNILDAKSKAIVINGGGFGKRFAQICKFHKLKHQNAKIALNQEIDFNKLDKSCDTLFVNAHETSIGRIYDLQQIGSFCKKHDMLYVVDAISAFGCDKINMTKQSIDMLIVSSNKGLTLPPGLVMIVLNQKAIKNLKQSRSFYMDFKTYLEDGMRGQTPFTPPICIINQLHQRLKDLSKIGIKKQIQKSKKLAVFFRKNIKDLPFKFYSTNMPNAMTALKLKNQNANEFIKDFEKKYNITLTPGGKKLGYFLVRIAHMGNLKKKDIKYLLSCLKDYFKDKK